jgi:hypothetical protein
MRLVLLSSWTWFAPITVPTGPDGAGGPPPSSSTSYGTTSVLVGLERGVVHALRLERARLVEPNLQGDVVLVGGSGSHVNELVPDLRFRVEVAATADEVGVRVELD